MKTAFSFQNRKKYFYPTFLKAIFFFLILTCLYQNLFAFERNYDIQHIRLSLRFNIEEEILFGTATLTITPLIDNFSTFKLHAKKMSINNIQSPEFLSVDFRYDSEKISVIFPDTISKVDTFNIIISYQTQPVHGLYFNKINKKNIKSTLQIYTHSEPEDAAYWFPCFDSPDEKVTSEIIGTVPESFFLLSNGRLIENRLNKKNKTRAYHWHQEKPHSIYLISLTAGKYAELKDHAGNVPLYYYVPPHQEKHAANSFAKTADMLKYFERTFGYPYPWNKYAQIVVADYQAGGMEHTGATTLNDYTIHDKRAHHDRNSDDLVAHELAHQWFGNLVTCKDWSHLWLNEGFATYAEILYKEHDLGKAEAQFANYSDQQFYLEMANEQFPQPIIYESYLNPKDMFNYIEYQKAGQILHMLRHVIGDSFFQKCLKIYLNRFKFSSAETEDFQNIVEEVTGKNMNWFFEQWLYHGGHPKFSIMTTWKPEQKRLFLYVNQTQTDTMGLVPEVFKMPVSIEIFGQEQRLIKEIEIDARKDTFFFPFNRRPLLTRFDKENYLLKEMKFFKSQDEWIYQLLHDENVGARLDALNALEDNSQDTLATILALEKSLAEDTFWAVRREAAYLLLDFHRTESKDVLAAACTDPNPKVRAAAISTLSSFYNLKYNKLFRKIAAQDSSYRVVAAALYALSNVADEFSFNFISRFVNQDSDRDIVRTAALHALLYLKDEQSLPVALSFSRDTTNSSYHRISSLNLLKEIGIGNIKVESLLIELLDDSDRYVRKKSIEILGYFESEKAFSALKNLRNEQLQPDIKRKLDIAIQRIERSMSRKKAAFKRKGSD